MKQPCFGRGTIRLETLIELEFIDSSFSSLSSCRNWTSSSPSSDSTRQHLGQRYPPASSSTFSRSVRCTYPQILAHRRQHLVGGWPYHPLTVGRTKRGRRPGRAIANDNNDNNNDNNNNNNDNNDNDNDNGNIMIVNINININNDNNNMVYY